MNRESIYRIRRLHAAARRRWPQIDWPLEQLEDHFEDTWPAHPLDLYLAGAAGQRIDSAWEVIETELCPQAVRLLKRSMRSPLECEDLVARARTKWMKEDTRLLPLADGRQPAIIGRYRGLVSLLNYMLTTARRLAISDRRQPWPIALLPGSVERGANGLQPHAADCHVSTESGSEPCEAGAMVHQALPKAFAELSLEQQFLLRKIISEGMNQRQAGQLLGLSEFKTSRELTKARRYLRHAIGELADVAWTRSFREAWSQCWTMLLKQVPISPPASYVPSSGRSSRPRQTTGSISRAA